MLTINSCSDIINIGRKLDRRNALLYKLVEASHCLYCGAYIEVDIL
jgi:predicted nucleic acid-binding Zn ribbon protein